MSAVSADSKLRREDAQFGLAAHAQSHSQHDDIITAVLHFFGAVVEASSRRPISAYLACSARWAG